MMRQLIYICFTAVLAANTLPAAEFKVAVLPDEICTLQVPLKIGFQLGIPARHNSAFYAECFSPDALRQEIIALNARVEIGLLVKQQVDPESGEIIVFMSNTSEELKGVTLRSGHLLRGKRYIATATGGKIRGERRVTLRVSAPDSSCRIDLVDSFSRWRKQSKLRWRFTPEQSGSHLCTFLIEPDSEILIHGFSLLPEETLSIWRKESIDVLKSTGAGSFRWPVVDDMDFYNWYDGIGALNERSAVQPEKTGLNHHDFGTAEYVDFCRLVGVEPLICVPLYTPACSDPRIRSLEAAAQMAADWVAYCNAAAGHPLAVLRERNGYGAPLRVNNWELVVPEPSGLISPAMLAEGCQRTVQMMKEQDSAILVGATLKGKEIATLDALLQRVGKQLDFVSCYAPGALEKVKAYNAANNARIMFADTLMQGADDPQGLRIAGELAAAAKLPVDYYINWYRSLGIAGAAVARPGLCLDGPVCLPYYAEQVLGLDHGSTRLSTDIALLSAMIGRFPAVVPLKTELSAENKAEALSVHPAWSEDRSVLVIFVHNPLPETQELQLDLSALKKPLVFWVMDQIGADFSASPPGAGVPVLRTQRAGSALNKVVECQIKGASFSRILVKE
ncbi:MAG: hypothetical protein PHO37_16825 [Kiritimatiellae bacterium]|nr:hypothetical protein [Kiritimatiellia bacterium]